MYLHSKYTNFKFNVLFIVSFIIFPNILLADRTCGSTGTVTGNSIVTINGMCNVTIKPDQATITGSVHSDDPDPVEAHKKIEQKVVEIEQLLKNKSIHLDNLGLTRSMIQPQPVYNNSLGSITQEPRFYYAGMLELMFSPEADIDTILKILKNSSFNFGNSPRNDNNSQGSIVRYRFSNYFKLINENISKCKQDAALQYCQNNLGITNSDALKECQNNSLKNLTVKDYNFNSRPVLLDTGYPSSIYISYPSGSSQPQDLMIAKSIELTGSINWNMALGK